MKFEQMKDRFMEAAEEGIIERQKGDSRVSALWEEVSSQKGKHKKTVALLSLVHEILPRSVSDKLAKQLDYKDYTELPFDPEEYEVHEKKLGRGRESKVYRLESRQEDKPSYVVKFNFGEEKSVDDLVQVARKDKADYEEVSQTYADIPGLIPKEMSLITTNRKDRKPVVATVQEFLGGGLKDVFSDLDKQELKDLLLSDKNLEQEFCRFVDISNRTYQETGQAVDLLGYQNLAIAKTEDGYHLKFLDPHNVPEEEFQLPERIVKIENALNYLTVVKEEVEQDRQMEQAA